jgi:monovalent cation:H+ antiporter-2, CPA2 family
LVQKLFWQVMLNVVLITGIIIAVSYFADEAERVIPLKLTWLGGPSGVLWLGSILIALPVFIACFRKFEALSLLLAEMTIDREALGKNSIAIRGVVSRAIFIVGNLAVGIWVLIISSALLPSWPVLIIFLAIIAGVGVIWRNRFIQVYAQAQVAIRETLTYSASHSHLENRLPEAFGHAELQTVPITNECFAKGKLIGELQLRNKTGASAVGIERNGENIVNPGPDEELQVGDVVLLLGHGPQLETAQAYLKEGLFVADGK